MRRVLSDDDVAAFNTPCSLFFYKKDCKKDFDFQKDTNATPGSELATLLTGEGGLPSVKLTSADGCTATAYLFGGVVTSFVKEVRTGNLDMLTSCHFHLFTPLSNYMFAATRMC